MAFYDKDEIKNSLSSDDIYRFIEELGGEPQKTSEGIVARTICHNGKHEGSEKLYYYDNTKLFHCYTQCGSMDIFELLTRVHKIENNEELSFYQAMDTVAKYFGIEGEEPGFRLLESQIKTDLEILEDYKMLLNDKEDITINYKIYPETLINNLSFTAPSSWVAEGISPEVMERYQIRYYGTTHKIVIPHRNIQGDLIGIRGRTIDEEEAKRYGKYMPLTVGDTMYNHPLSQNLYGLYENLDNINSLKKIIIFEGEKSVMHYESMFGEKNNIAVATCGSSISLFQEEIIKHFCKVDEVIIAYDKEFEEIGDLNFKKNVAMLTRMGNRLKPYFNVSILFDKDKENPKLRYKDAPVDQGKEVFEWLYNNRIKL